ncbi:DUF4149 domain-containing protein [Paucibacter sp. Y2R2-4]|uniref:DUF4149 domain-containing protein n=1 Tax=Paucibacter sp. Y2R2-4 TaxID=2893553 RepID=UPI002962555A|nr:DUF4149 domain-containing protein [Paucibacter sp. Y2R2-4]
MNRFRALLAALWGGLLLSVAWVAAPSAFAVLERAQAGLLVARLFSLEAQLSLAAGLLLMLMERRLARDRGLPAISAEFLLPAAAVFCTVAGYYALQPMMAAAKSGQGPWSFGALHGVSLVFYGIKLLLVLALAWRSTAAKVQAPITDPARSS